MTQNLNDVRYYRGAEYSTFQDVAIGRVLRPDATSSGNYQESVSGEIREWKPVITT